MILADKILELRKKNNWSQEELAEQLGVSRQSVSKWESAQSVPDLNRIIEMSKVFGVSVDYLVQDEMEELESNPLNGEEDSTYKVRRVSMEEANAFMDLRKKASKSVALGVFLMILSPAALICLLGLSESGAIGFTETTALIIGLVILFLLGAIGVGLCMHAGMLLEDYEYIEKENIETAYGVNGLVKERKSAYRATRAKLSVIGVLFCILSPVLIFFQLNNEANILILGVPLLLLMVACGVFLLLKANMQWESYQMLLEEEDYSREKKASQKRLERVSGIYWLSVVGIFIAYGLITNNWSHAWIIWPVAGIVYAILSLVLDGKSDTH